MAVDTRPRRIPFVTLLCCIVFAVPAAVGLAAAPPDQERRDTPPPPPPVGTSRISGQVVAADNGAPVKRAVVSVVGRSTLTGGRGGAGGVTTGVVGGSVRIAASGGAFASGPFPPQVTDDAGRFEFGDVPAGVYSIMVAPRSGFVRPQRLQQVEVADGITATVAIRLERTGAITGRLLDESGDPIARARVVALRRQRGAGGRLTPTGSGASTDDLGQFRLFDLPAGEYFVSGSDTYGGPPNTAVPAQGYGPTYFPGSASLDGARPVAVKSAQDTPGIDFSLVRVAMGRVTGTLRDSKGQVAAGRANVSLARRSEESVAFGRSGYVRPDGSFTITEVPPGEYFAVASVSFGDGPNMAREGAYVPVSVNGNEVTLDIRTNTGATVRGRVLVEGTPPPMPTGFAERMPPDVPRISVQARPAAMGSPLAMATGNARPVTPAEDGTFELTGLRGPTVLTASGMRLALKMVTSGAADVTGRPIEFKGTERVSNVTIVLTYDVGTLEGTVTDDAGQPVPGASVIIFFEDDSRWFEGSPYIHYSRSMPAVQLATARPPETAAAPGVLPAARRAPPPGWFMSTGLLPGRYLVAALEGDGMQGVSQLDRDSLERLRKQAVVATISVGSTATVQLRALKTF